MAHRISHANGRAEMAYSGETPWHGLGVKVDGLQTTDAMLAAAGLEWNVSTTPLYINADQPRGTVPHFCEVDGHVAIRRDDTGRVLGVATDRYTPIQNAQSGELMDALITEGGAHVEVAGALDEGERCWMLAHIPADFDVVKGDTVRPYMLLAWGHDGKHGVAGKLTSVRVVCNNTLTAAGFGAGNKWSAVADVYLRHSGKVSLRIDEARRALGVMRHQVDSTAAAYRSLAARNLTGAEIRDYFETVFPYAKAAAGAAGESDAESIARLMGASVDTLRKQADEARARVDEIRDTVARLMGSGAGSEYAPGTAWGAYNAVTEYADHVYPMLKSGQVSPHRQASVLFGAMGETKQRALTAALDLAAV